MAIDTILLGNNIKRCRENLDLEVYEISENIGIQIKRINEIEKGLIEPTGDEILIFADFYKQDYKYFISNEKLSASEQIEVLYRKLGTDFSKEDPQLPHDCIVWFEVKQRNAIQSRTSKGGFQKASE